MKRHTVRAHLIRMIIMESNKDVPTWCKTASTSAPGNSRMLNSIKLNKLCNISCIFQFFQMRKEINLNSMNKLFGLWTHSLLILFLPPNACQRAQPNSLNPCCQFIYWKWNVIIIIWWCTFNLLVQWKF